MNITTTLLRCDEKKTRRRLTPALKTHFRFDNPKQIPENPFDPASRIENGFRVRFSPTSSFGNWFFGVNIKK